MNIDIKTAVVQSLSILVFVGGIIFLQIILSKKENKWLGLILPGLTLLVSIVAVLNVPIYSLESMSLNGEVVQETVQHNKIGDTIVHMVTIFLTYNIPTVIMLAIYTKFRKKRQNLVAPQ
jgi:hypothetical protein